MAEEKKMTKQLKPVFVGESELPTLFVNVVSVRAGYVDFARVLNPFYIRVQPVEEGFAAVSDISDVYELGGTTRQAVANYLFSLVDEIIWFQKHEESLSRPMLRDFAKLQFYIGLV